MKYQHKSIGTTKIEKKYQQTAGQCTVLIWKQNKFPKEMCGLKMTKHTNKATTSTTIEAQIDGIFLPQ